MLFLQFLVPLAALVTGVLGKKCHHDNCFRAIACYERNTSAAFCSNYLATAYTLPPSILQILINSQTVRRPLPMLWQNVAPPCVLSIPLTPVRLAACLHHLTAHLQRLLLLDYFDHHDHNHDSYTYTNINPLNLDLLPLERSRLPHARQPLLCLPLRRGTGTLLGLLAAE